MGVAPMRCRLAFAAAIVWVCFIFGLGPKSSIIPQEKVRIATFNVALNRSNQGQLLDDLRHGDPQARTLAVMIQRGAPDIIRLNEFDYAIPSRIGLSLINAEVLWPYEEDEIFRLIGTYPFPGSDHRLLFIDVEVVE